MDGCVLDGADGHLPTRRATRLLENTRARLHTGTQPIIQRVHAVREWFTGRAVLPEPAPSHLSIKYSTQPAEPRGMALIICNIIDDTAVQTHYGIVAFS